MAGIYIHIPFCKTRCIYCDFYSSTRSELKEQYIHALCKELKARKEYLRGETIKTIYWGGGTPSQLAEEDFRQVFDTIEDIYGLNTAKEITLEANPDDLTPEYLEMLASLPFNRLSIGVQTFNEETLQLLKRRHSAQQAIEAFGNARKAGFQNISIDLMYGLPGETVDSWAKDLSTAINLKPEHLSAYHLIYEEGTPLFNMLQSSQIKEVNEEKSLLFFQMLMEQLKKAGYEHYEISNFSLPRLQSQHNTSYWEGVPYLGCGASAHSFNKDSREWNVSSIDAYIKGIETDNRVYEIETLDKNTQYNDYIITSLRTNRGIDISRLTEEFGKEYMEYCFHTAQKYLKNEELKLENNHLILTQKGIFVSNSIMSDLLKV
ncbi:radical SAM family heme chaperone HemW [Bacteroides sp. 224]|uniref:radical SAM family heme chaperone HemW n=1 Tax=Bacteroides sp. 224 TaxID=2302936 RepID=UPI0013D42815|nr:radical SAM family heme chaperone HemW [Bacteroides sp. 224]NDV66946.1 radical SAM family heme chaperone HemW [Bacteroides sp. 224]